jgi:hypothetical protein
VDKVDGQHQPAKAEAVATAKEDQVLSKPNATIQINLEKATGDESLGVTLALPDKTTLLVKAIKDTGTVVTYNKVSPPDVQLREGDSIVGINGVSGDTDKMLDEIKHKNLLALSVQRNNTGSTGQDAAASDTSTQPPEAENAEPATEQGPQEGTTTTTTGKDPESKAAEKVAEPSVGLDPRENVPADRSVGVAFIEEAKTSVVVEPVEGEGNADDKGCQVCRGWF